MHAVAAASDVHFTTDRVIICSCLKKVPCPTPAGAPVHIGRHHDTPVYLSTQGKHQNRLKVMLPTRSKKRANLWQRLLGGVSNTINYQIYSCLRLHIRRQRQI
jgi:hypothetical protein